MLNVEEKIIMRLKLMINSLESSTLSIDLTKEKGDWSCDLFSGRTLLSINVYSIVVESFNHYILSFTLFQLNLHFA